LSQAQDKKNLLTAREKEVLKLIADGYTNEGAAKKLRISQKTIEYHRNNIRMKTGIESLAGLVKFAILMGLTTADANEELDQIRH
jgi:DNA-binding NarL/FixJ family response regulator